MCTSAKLVAVSEPQPPHVSAIVPAYNSAATIERCIRSLTTQTTETSFEIIVVDSGTDDTCAHVTHVHPAVRTIKLTEPAVPPQARHVGATEARGDILAFIDSDAYATNDWIDRVVEASNKGYDLVCGSIGNANQHSAISHAEQLLMHSEFLPEAPGGPSWFALSGNMVLTRKSYQKYGPFVETRAAEDIVFSRRLLHLGGTILFFPAMRVDHDNRTTLAKFLRNQIVVGKYTAQARRLVPFNDTRYYVFFLMLLPVAPAAKFAKLLLRLTKWDRSNLARVFRSTPLLLLGMSAYSLGMVAGVMSQAPQLECNAATYSRRSPPRVLRK